MIFSAKPRVPKNKNMFCFNYSFLCLTIFMFITISFNLFADPQDSGQRDDSAVARQYVEWIQKAIGEERWEEAFTALRRAIDFSAVSSDISYLFAVANSRLRGNRSITSESLVDAIETNRWVNYNEMQARLLLIEQFIAMQNYLGALQNIEQLKSSSQTTAGSAQLTADSVMLELRTLRGMAMINSPNYDSVQSQARFRSLVVTAMDRYPRDPRPLRIFFEYANNRRHQLFDLPGFASEERGISYPSDLDLLEFALRRLPFLLEADPDLAWMAASFMRDLEDARRMVASYRSGGLSGEQTERFIPTPASIPIALNLGVIDDTTAVQELFAEPAGGALIFERNTIIDVEELCSGPADGTLVIEKKIIIDVYNLLRSEEGRELFTQKMISFPGVISCDEDSDGYIDYFTIYRSGVLSLIMFDRNKINVFDMVISCNTDSIPVSSLWAVEGNISHALIQWIRYPSVEEVTLDKYVFKFAPTEFNFAPVTFIELGGSRTLSGIPYPVPLYQNMTLTYHSLLASCNSLSRPSLEIAGATETIFFDRGRILQVVETLNERQVSITEFERGLPVVQHIDLDLDGRMETIRRFRRPPPGYVWEDILDYRRLIASSESDWSGDGRHKTTEVYQLDGSVVYSWDMDGSGEINYSETGNQ
ncbi:MAG: hypothetical protein LBI28_13805 [Treponema sp.]|jgi:hypothetical protein|nr:hypothetical protein [Treponema sp.]